MRISDWSSDVCSSDLACSDKWRGVEAVDPREDFDAFLGDPLRLSGIGRLRDIPRPGHAIPDDPLGLMAHAIDVRNRYAALFEQHEDRGLTRQSGKRHVIKPFISTNVEGERAACPR